MELCEAVHSRSGCVTASSRRGDNYDVHVPFYSARTSDPSGSGNDLGTTTRMQKKFAFQMHPRFCLASLGKLEKEGLGVFYQLHYCTACCNIHVRGSIAVYSTFPILLHNVT